MMMGMNSEMDNRSIFAVDIGGSKLLAGVVESNGEAHDLVRKELPPDITTDALEQMILGIWDHIKTSNHPLPSACGITIPGVADVTSGTWVYACFSGISNYPIVSRLESRLGIPVYIENDANACAWAEKVFGLCQDCDDYMWITVSNGVGGGLVLNGKLYRGFCEGAGEFGHLIIEPDGRLCPCGHVGCMEAMAAGPGIAFRYEKLTGSAATAMEIAQRARNGEATALQVMQDTGTYIGRGLGKAACLINVKRYVLGGGVMQSFDLMEEAIRTAFFQEAFARPNREAEIVQTGLGYEAALLGAAAIAFRPVL